MDLDKITDADKVILKKKLFERLALPTFGLVALSKPFNVLEGGDDEEEKEEEEEQEEHDTDADEDEKTTDGGDEEEEEEDVDGVIADYQDILTARYQKAHKGPQVDNIFASKIGGYPYLPHDALTKDYKDMALVFQLNCGDIDHDLFPKQGLLQFFVQDKPTPASGKSGIGSVIKYWRSPDCSVLLKDVKAKYSIDENEGNCILPFEEGYCQFVGFRSHKNLNYSIDACYPVLMEEVQKYYDLKSIPDHAEDKKVYTAKNEWQKRMVVGKKYGCNFTPSQCYQAIVSTTRPVDSNVGGHYGWAQDDPLSPGWACHPGVKREEAITLLFLDSNTPCHNPRIDIMWGDMGTAGWLINKEDLLNLDFDKHCFFMDS